MTDMEYAKGGIIEGPPVRLERLGQYIENGRVMCRHRFVPDVADDDGPLTEVMLVPVNEADDAP